MGGLLSNYPKWQRLRIMTPKQNSIDTALGETLNPTTPIPVFNSEALKQISQQGKVQIDRKPFYYTQPDQLPGLSACEAALDECLRRYGIISSELWVSNDCMKELIADMLRRYKSRFNGFVPYLYSNGTLSPNGEVIMQIMPVPVIIDVNVYTGDIVCILP
jgi:hypothetical protein